MADNDVLIVIPARMASTRLPGKPLADIAGEPMIVHVMRRAQEAGLGAVVVATDSEAIAACVEKAGGRAVMTRADHVSGSDRIFEALGSADPTGALRHRRQRAGRPADARPADIARRHRPAATIPRSTSRRSPPRSAAPRSAAIRTWSRSSAPRCTARETGVRPAGCARSISPAPRRRQATARSTTISGSTRSAGRRWCASSACRPRRWNGASSSSNCARSKPACASTSRSSTACRSASIRRTIWNGRAALLGG